MLPALLPLQQVEVHPLWRNDELIGYCNSEGIHVSAYCPMGTPWTSAKAVIRRAEPASQHPVIREVARKYGKHELLIIMRWGLQHGTSILAKSSNPAHIKVWVLHACMSLTQHKEVVTSGRSALHGVHAQMVVLLALCMLVQRLCNAVDVRQAGFTLRCMAAHAGMARPC